MGSRPPEFDETASSWDAYRVRLEAYFEGNDITDSSKRRALLVASLSDSVVRVLQGRCPSTPVNSLTYEDVVKVLEEHYSPQVNETAASHAFFVRRQGDNEAVKDFVAYLRRLAKDCNFGSFLDRMLRDRIVCGIRDDEARRFLLTQRKLTLQEAEEFAMSSETADRNVRSMKDTDCRNDAGDVLLVQRRRSSGRKRGSGHDSEEPRHSCWRCGSSHSEHECQHVGKVCRKCGTKGHLARMCQRRRGGRQAGSYALSELSEGEDSKEEMLFALSAQNNVDQARMRPMERNLVWGGRTLRMLVDTGSSVSVIPKNVFRNNRKWWPRLEKTPLRLSCFLGPLPVLGRVAMSVEHDKTRVDSSLVVVDCDGPLLCGRDTIQAFREAGLSLLEERALPSVYALQAEDDLKELVEEFADLFEDRLGCCKGPPVKLYKKEGAVPRFLKARPVPFALRKAVSAEIDRLVQQGILSPVSVSEWAAPVVPVVKKNGDIRLCGDFKLTVNPATHLEQYPLPKVDDIFAALYGGEVFTTLDLRNAYNQLPLDEEAKEMTVINTHQGLYSYNRLAFGISSAPALFQRRIESLLRDLPRVRVYLDDIIIAEKQQDTSTLRQVFQRLRDSGLQLNKAKCRFREREVQFLGHKIDTTGLHPLRDNLEAVTAAPKPESEDSALRQVREWIEQGWPSHLAGKQQHLQPYFTRRHELVASHDLVYWGHRVVVPEAARQCLLNELH
ncbi:uncharacterized protein K02A2.6-like [Rhipicephalus sanguineus]|uniref:uncharacterized protein K02A2.6-like n=1 Tax=Rhipicephalus sanguineus TaxID=34632 RepID=UPI0020C28CFA|nr:uncharacterized protein K02A2.6-like [Rhipicephalus sanguineus]